MTQSGGNSVDAASMIGVTDLILRHTQTATLFQ
jgi:hypothetical protein